MVDLGDLTWNKEHDLACPDNLLGTVDLYLATRHGLNGAGLPALVHGLKPRVSVINNGGTKGASPEHFRTIQWSPGLDGAVRQTSGSCITRCRGTASRSSTRPRVRAGRI